MNNGTEEYKQHLADQEAEMCETSHKVADARLAEHPVTDAEKQREALKRTIARSVERAMGREVK